jgi:hypothetical protein
MKNQLKTFANSDLVKDIRKVMNSSVIKESEATEETAEQIEKVTEESEQVDERAVDTEAGVRASMSGTPSTSSHSIVHRTTGQVVKKFNNFNQALAYHKTLQNSNQYVIKKDVSEGEEKQPYSYYVETYLQEEGLESLSQIPAEELQVVMDVIEIAFQQQVENFEQIDEVSVEKLLKARAAAKRKASSAEEKGDEGEVMKRTSQASKFGNAAKAKHNKSC